ncbi:MAG: zf-TFIIB domain-containing protein [Chloroflexota bacterium]
MICPVCRQVMIVVEHQKIELDYCTRCHGVWFDSGELELLLERAGREKLPLTEALAKSRAERRLRCPICTQKMKETLVGKQPEVTVDLCPKGDGIWFDGGELKQVVAQCAPKPCGTTPPEQDLLGFLGETFQAEKEAPPKTD